MKINGFLHLNEHGIWCLCGENCVRRQQRSESFVVMLMNKKMGCSN